MSRPARTRRPRRKQLAASRRKHLAGYCRKTGKQKFTTYDACRGFTVKTNGPDDTSPFSCGWCGGWHQTSYGRAEMDARRARLRADGVDDGAGYPEPDERDLSEPTRLASVDEVEARLRQMYRDLGMTPPESPWDIAA